MEKELKKGAVVLFKEEERPNIVNTAIVKRVAKDKSWADVSGPFFTQRVYEPNNKLKVVDAPFILDLI